MKRVNLNRKLRRKRRISSHIFGTKERPRISVFRSNRYFYAQAIDDKNRLTLASFSSLILSKDKNYNRSTKTEEAKKIGLLLAEIFKKKKIKKGVLDRGIYSYQGRVKSFVEGLREGGIII